MEVILLERVEKLGAIGDVVTVKNGFARNYLLPNKKALRANESNRKLFEANRAKIEADNADRSCKPAHDIPLLLLLRYSLGPPVLTMCTVLACGPISPWDKSKRTSVPTFNSLKSPFTTALRWK